jgi:hypothetical protein
MNNHTLKLADKMDPETVQSSSDEEDSWEAVNTELPKVAKNI